MLSLQLARQNMLCCNLQQPDRSWNLWDVFGMQKHEYCTELAGTIRSQAGEDKKIVPGKAPDRLSLVSVGTH